MKGWLAMEVDGGKESMQSWGVLCIYLWSDESVTGISGLTR